MLNLLFSSLDAARRPLAALLRTRAVAKLCEPRGVDHYVELFAPAWSAHEIRARVVGVQRESSDTVSLLLAPNANWGGFLAGQHVLLAVSIAGTRHVRAFSISSPPHAGAPLRITIRAFAGGRVSTWAFEHARCGDIVVLSPAQGDFVLSEPAPTRLLFITGGSGITPVISMLRELRFAGYAGQVTWLHYARDEVVFQNELALLAQDFARFTFVPQLTGRPLAMSQSRPRLSLDSILAADAEWQSAEVFVCGPAALERIATQIWSDHGLLHHLHVEHFQRTDQNALRLDDDDSSVRQIEFARSGLSAQGRGSASLLEQAESAGLRPAYGCRMGICHTCKCLKHSGVVRNIVTGEISSAENETIQLCIHTPLSDVSLDL